MTVTLDQIDKAKAAGLHNVDAAAEVADEIPMTFYQLCALLEKESNGKNVFGNDVGGTLRGFKDPVTEANWRAFRHEVLTNGRPSNGIGPCQLTYKGYFTAMEAQGLRPWVPHDNILYGGRIYWDYYRDRRAAGIGHSNAIRWAGTFYNAGPDTKQIIGYGDRLLEMANKWRALVGIADTANRSA